MVNQESALERIFQPRDGGLPKDLAQYILQLDFPPRDQARYQELSLKAHEGALTGDEKRDLDELLAANDVLTILQSKARKSLSSRTPAA